MRTRGPHSARTRATLGALLAPLLLAVAPHVAQAQRPLRGPTAAATAPRPVAATLRLEAKLGERTLYVWSGDSLLALYPVAVGKPDHPTPRGTFTIERLIWNPGWVPPDTRWARGKEAQGPQDPGNPMRVVKLFFREPDYYLHGTNRAETVGSAASHGCLRLRPEDAAALGLLVMRHGGEARDEAWLEEVLESGTTRTVRLPTPVEMQVR